MIKLYDDFDDFIKDYQLKFWINDYDYNILKCEFDINNHLLIIVENVNNYSHCYYNDRCKYADCSLKEECGLVYKQFMRQQKLERICNEKMVS